MREHAIYFGFDCIFSRTEGPMAAIRKITENSTYGNLEIDTDNPKIHKPRKAWSSLIRRFDILIADVSPSSPSVIENPQIKTNITQPRNNATTRMIIPL